MILIKADEAALLLGLKDKHGKPLPGTARKVLHAWRVPSVNLGRGRGKGLRWDRDDIVSAIERAKDKGRPKPRMPKKRLPAEFEMRPCDLLRALDKGGAIQ